MGQYAVSIGDLGDATGAVSEVLLVVDKTSGEMLTRSLSESEKIHFDLDYNADETYTREVLAKMCSDAAEHVKKYDHVVTLLLTMANNNGVGTLEFSRAKYSAGNELEYVDFAGVIAQNNSLTAANHTNYSVVTRLYANGDTPVISITKMPRIKTTVDNPIKYNEGAAESEDTITIETFAMGTLDSEGHTVDVGKRGVVSAPPTGTMAYYALHADGTWYPAVEGDGTTIQVTNTASTQDSLGKTVLGKTVITAKPMTGAKATVYAEGSTTEGHDGTAGIVPAPTKEQAAYVLYGTGEWASVKVSTNGSITGDGSAETPLSVPTFSRGVETTPGVNGLVPAPSSDVADTAILHANGTWSTPNALVFNDKQFENDGSSAEDAITIVTYEAPTRDDDDTVTEGHAGLLQPMRLNAQSRTTAAEYMLRGDGEWIVPNIGVGLSGSPLSSESPLRCNVFQGKTEETEVSTPGIVPATERADVVLSGSGWTEMMAIPNADIETLWGDA